MSTAIDIDERQPTPVTTWKAGLVKWGSIASAWGLLIISVVMIVMCMLSSVGIVLRTVELFLGASNFLAGVLLLREAMNKKHTSVIVSMWSGEIALAATFFKAQGLGEDHLEQSFLRAVGHDKNGDNCCR